MKNFKELYEGIKKVDVVQRKRMARRMAKMAKSPAFQKKKERAALKMRDPAKLQAAAKKKVVKSFRDKFYPGYNEMSLQQRVVVDQKLNQRVYDYYKLLNETRYLILHPKMQRHL